MEWEFTVALHCNNFGLCSTGHNGASFVQLSISSSSELLSISILLFLLSRLIFSSSELPELVEGAAFFFFFFFMTISSEELLSTTTFFFLFPSFLLLAFAASHRAALASRLF
jgi:hypothetical protein